MDAAEEWMREGQATVREEWMVEYWEIVLIGRCFERLIIIETTGPEKGTHLILPLTHFLTHALAHTLIHQMNAFI